MPLSSSKAVASRSSSGCSFGRSPSPMNSIQVLPTRLGSEYIDTPDYRKIIIIRYAEYIQDIQNYLTFYELISETSIWKLTFLVPNIQADGIFMQ
jgi:hypothetical protein